MGQVKGFDIEHIAPLKGYRTFVVKAVWRSTATTYKVPARTEEEAIKRVEGLVKKEMGWRDCLEIKFIREEA
jgi:hypothetical protein